MSKVPVITIDGLSGAGKGTVSKMLCAELGWNILDSGALYRTLTLFGVKHKLFEDGIDIKGVDQSEKDLPFKSAEIDSFGDHRIATVSYTHLTLPTILLV